MKILKNRAFTLAEVLITLGIIGVVAAITIPTLITNYQKRQTALGVKKAYTELNQIVRMATADYGDPSGWDYYGENELQQWVETYIKPYAKVTGSKICASSNNCFGLIIPKGGAYVLSKMGTPVGYAFYRYGGVYSPVTRVRVYLNSSKKKFDNGKNAFTFILSTADSNPRFKPYGLKSLGSYGMSTDDRKVLLGTGWGGCNPKASGSGYWEPMDACAAVIMMDGWQISKDYPWIK